MLVTHRALVLLSASASLLVLGCFIDSGSVTGASSGGSEATGSDSTSSTATSSTITSATTEETTTNQTTTADTTSSSGETTNQTDATSTGPSCEGCKPGTVDTSSQCGSCGLQERVCGDDCSWGPYTCVEQAENCAYWRLPTGNEIWEHHPLVAEGDDTTHAPTSPVLAAYDIDARREAFVFTATDYHVIDLDTRTWTDSGTIQAYLPALANKTILAAYAVPDGEGANLPTGEDSVTFITPTVAYLYNVSHADAKATADGEVSCCDDEWEGIGPPKTTAVRAFWVAIDDADPWADIPLQMICNNAPKGAKLLRYAAAITDTRVHLQDVSYCFNFVAEIPFSNWKPFTLKTGPESGMDVGAAFINNGELWVFRGE